MQLHYFSWVYGFIDNCLVEIAKYSTRNKMEQAERRAEGNYMSKDMPVMKETIVGNISQLLAKVETRIDTLVEIVNGDERRDKNVRISQKFIDGTIVSIDDWNVLKITKDNFEGNTSAAYLQEKTQIKWRVLYYADQPNPNPVRVYYSIKTNCLLSMRFQQPNYKYSFLFAYGTYELLTPYHYDHFMIVFAEQSLSKRREGKDKHKIVKDVGIEESYRQIDEEFPTAEQVYRTQTHNEDTDCANAEAETQYASVQAYLGRSTYPIQSKIGTGWTKFYPTYFQCPFCEHISRSFTEHCPVCGEEWGQI